MILQELVWFFQSVYFFVFRCIALEGSIALWEHLDVCCMWGYWGWMSWMPLIPSYSTCSQIISLNPLTSVKPHVAHSVCPLGLNRHLLSSSQPRMKSHSYTQSATSLCCSLLGCLVWVRLHYQPHTRWQQLQHQLLTFTTSTGWK